LRKAQAKSVPFDVLDPQTFPFAEFNQATQSLQVRCVFIASRSLSAKELKSLQHATQRALQSELGDDIIVGSGTVCGLGISCHGDSAFVRQKPTVDRRDRPWAY
jgi:hypothetical protein